MKKIICLSLILAFCLSSASCSNTDSNSNSNSIESSLEDTSQKYINYIIIDEHLWKQNGNSDINNDYIINFPYPSNICRFSYKNKSCEFSLEKGKEIIQKFQSYNPEEYEPNHANEDGLMITEYKPYTVQVMYIIKKEINGKETFKAEPGVQSGHFYTLSESNYNNLIHDFNNLEQIAEQALSDSK